MGIADVPTVNGGPGKPFVGVLAAGISAVSTNHELARQFMEDYLLTESGLHSVNDDKPPAGSSAWMRCGAGRDVTTLPTE